MIQTVFPKEGTLKWKFACKNLGGGLRISTCGGSERSRLGEERSWAVVQKQKALADPTESCETGAQVKEKSLNVYCLCMKQALGIACPWPGR